MVLLSLGPHAREIHAGLWDVRVRRERRRGKQLLQQKHEARPHGWRPAPGVRNSGQPAPPSPSPHTARSAVDCPDLTGQRALIPEECKLGSTSLLLGGRRTSNHPRYLPRSRAGCRVGSVLPCSCPFQACTLGRCMTSTVPVFRVWAPHYTISLETGCWD